MSPRLIASASFADSLDYPEKNRTHTRGFLTQGVKPFELPGYAVPYGYRLVQSMDEHQIRLLAGDETVYYVKLKDGQFVIPKAKHITQVGVWRSGDIRHEHSVTSFARQVFAWLVENYSIVVSDSEQTGDGASFWVRRIRQAISHPSRYVYAWDGTDEDADPVEVVSVEDFLDNWKPQFWGVSPDTHQHRLFIITSYPLAG